jgi:phosphonate degradation associated HDIG domain protein
MSGPDSSSPNAGTIVAFIADIFARRGADSYLGEAVTMSEHMLQAALLAERAQADDALIAAALLHDIGHYTSEFPPEAQDEGIDNRHDQAGAAVLAPYFAERVVDCVRYHVAAKRYLCATDPDYFGRLSAASVLTLKLQGGPMSAAEVAEFRQLPHLEDILRVRVWDDEAKVPGRRTPPFAHYAPLLQRLVHAHRENLTATAKKGVGGPAPKEPGPSSCN